MHHLVEVVCTADGPDPELVADSLWTLGAVGVEELDGMVRGAFTDATSAGVAAEDVGGRRRTVDDGEGLDTWRRHAAVHRAGPFSVRPPWRSAVSGSIDLVIDPGHAFGSGSHPSTRLVLGLVADHVASGHQVVDLGTGSGVLAVAAARLGATVTAVDTDPAAAASVEANRTANQVGDRIRFRSGDASDVDGVFDVGLCNMTIGLHERLGPTLTADIGLLLIGGVLRGAQEDRVRAAHRRRIVARRVEGEWAALALG